MAKFGSGTDWRSLDAFPVYAGCCRKKHNIVSYREPGSSSILILSRRRVGQRNLASFLKLRLGLSDPAVWPMARLGAVIIFI